MPPGYRISLMLSRQVSSSGNCSWNCSTVYLSSFGMVCLRFMANLNREDYAICSTCCQGIITDYWVPGKAWDQRTWKYFWGNERSNASASELNGGLAAIP